MFEEGQGEGQGQVGLLGPLQLRVRQPSRYGPWSVTGSAWEAKSNGSWAGSELATCHISWMGVGELARWPVRVPLTPGFPVKHDTLPASCHPAYSQLKARSLCVSS